ncbi:MAG: flavin reductase [Sedimentisphaerales bacterium]
MANTGIAALRCGTVSGRDNDKFKQMGLTPVAAQTAKVPVIQECIMYYECRVVHRNDVVPGTLDEEIISSTYYARKQMCELLENKLLGKESPEAKKLEKIRKHKDRRRRRIEGKDKR